MNSLLVGAVLIPAAPALVPALGGSHHAANRAHQAVMSVLAQLLEQRPDEVLVVAEGTTTGEWGGSSSWSLERFGGLAKHREATSQSVLPASLAVGAALVTEGGWRGPMRFMSLPAAVTAIQAREVGREISGRSVRLGLVLLGNGSARSTEKAPGALHPDSEAFNRQLHEMVISGDVEAMMSVTAEEAMEQWSDIRIPLQVLVGTSEVLSLHGRSIFTQEFMGVYYLSALFLPYEEGGTPLTGADHD